MEKILSLTEIFNKLQSTHPDLVAGATPLDAGKSGLIMDHHDGTVSKLLFRMGDELQQKWAAENLNNELTFLRLIEGSPIHGIQTPVLIGDATQIDGVQFFASYRMTKLPGTPANWIFGQATDAHYFEAGQVLAHFHAATAGIKDAGLTVHGIEQGGEVRFISGLNDKRTAALARANNYIQTHKEPGLLHGDYYGGNIMLNESGRVSGLIDFALTGPSENRLLDFMNVPDAARPAFINGYEQASGKRIDPLMITMTDISRLAATINMYANNPVMRKQYLDMLDHELQNAKSVTAYTPT